MIEASRSSCPGEGGGGSRSFGTGFPGRALAGIAPTLTSDTRDELAAVHASAMGLVAKAEGV